MVDFPRNQALPNCKTTKTYNLDILRQYSPLAMANHQQNLLLNHRCVRALNDRRATEFPHMADQQPDLSAMNNDRH